MLHLTLMTYPQIYHLHTHKESVYSENNSFVWGANYLIFNILLVVQYLMKVACEYIFKAIMTTQAKFNANIWRAYNISLNTIFIQHWARNITTYVGTRFSSATETSKKKDKLIRTPMILYNLFMKHLYS